MVTTQVEHQETNMTDYQKWLDRIDNLIQLQRDMCLDLISANFTRRELIELKMMIEILMEEHYGKNNGNTN